MHAPNAASRRPPTLRGDVTDPPAGIRGLVHQLGPVLIAATTFGFSDVSAKIVLEAGGDVLSLLTFRSVVGIGLLFIWLRLGGSGAKLSAAPEMDFARPRPAAHPQSARRVQGDRIGSGVDRHPHLFHLPAADRADRRRDRHRSAHLAGRDDRHRRLCRPRADHRRQSRATGGARPRRGGRRRAGPGRHAADHPRDARRRRRAARHLVHLVVVDARVRRPVARDLELAAASHRARLDRVRRYRSSPPPRRSSRSTSRPSGSARSAPRST